MARQVVWSGPAWEDLEAAAEYIGRDSESYAAAFVQNVKEAAASLAHFAERGQVVPEISDESIRELLVKPYRLIYRIAPDRVLIVTLVTALCATGVSEKRKARQLHAASTPQ